jgi:hypothetical protein
LVSSDDLNSDSSDDDDDVDFDDDGDDSFLVGVGDMDVEEAILSGHHKIQFDDENENVEVSEAIAVEEAFINGEHRFIVDPDYEQERLLNIKVKESYSQLALSLRTLKNKHRAL